jgi:hypothetical protein
VDRSRVAAAAVLTARIGYGAALLAAPARVGKVWLGPASSTGPVQVPTRGLGAREVVLHCGALQAARTGAPLRGWLAASILGDVSDIASTFAARRELPEGVAGKTLAVAGLSALVSAALAACIDR